MRPGFDRVAVDFHVINVNPVCDVPTSRTARSASRLLSGNVRVCHPRGCLRGCLLEGHTGGQRKESLHQTVESVDDGPMDMGD
jgi:hypothetical protein